MTRYPSPPWRTRALLPTRDGAGRWVDVTVVRWRSVNVFAGGVSGTASLADVQIDGLDELLPVATARLEGLEDDALDDRPDTPARPPLSAALRRLEPAT